MSVGWMFFVGLFLFVTIIVVGSFTVADSQAEKSFARAFPGFSCPDLGFSTHRAHFSFSGGGNGTAELQSHGKCLAVLRRYAEEQRLARLPRCAPDRDCFQRYVGSSRYEIELLRTSTARDYRRGSFRPSFDGVFKYSEY